ncbi:MAG: hypothetical protein QM644_04655, partial [Mobilitalea sp.]
MKRIFQGILFLAVIIIIVSISGKTSVAAAEYNFKKNDQTTYKGEEIFVISENITRVDFKPFEEPSYPEVKEIVIIEGVTYLDWDLLLKGVFPNVEIVNIPKTVTKINCSGYDFYDKLKNLKKINVAADNTSYSSDLDCLFDKDKKVL